MRIAVTMLVLGCAIRFFATLPGLEDGLESQTKFLLVLVGGAIIEVGHPFSMIVATKVEPPVEHSSTPWEPGQPDVVPGVRADGDHRHDGPRPQPRHHPHIPGHNYSPTHKLFHPHVTKLPPQVAPRLVGGDSTMVPWLATIFAPISLLCFVLCFLFFR